MLIISQDKDTMINFDNIEILGIGNPLEDDDGKFKILANTTSDSQYTLARYDTEEKAKEILEDLTRLYRKCQQVVGERGGLVNFIYPPKVYEMPKE